ncbi:uncharacterized protein LOC123546294 [Mercenaria mercenaria]|uniref:uncharacterized protein LOC123546294 n=1 Tax=Mercenaria mercenaria TaxID=6596 RepID=UPI00234E8567|nr:uncharacterized protein LOC123546294 [Mercenaria mercenaria]
MENSTFSIVEELNRNLTLAVLPVTIFIGVEAFVGTFGNILILLIYTKRYGRSNFRCFVLSMAVIDLTSCFTTLPGEIFSQMNWYTYEYDWVCRVKSYFNVLTAWGSASILLLLAFDRHRKICKPLAWQIQPSFALKLCICSMALSGIVASPIAILWGKQTYNYQYQGLNLTVSICEKSSQYADGIYPLVYIGCVYILPVGIILLVLCSLNIITARELFGKKSPEVSIRDSVSSMFTSESTTTIDATETDIDSFDMKSSAAKHLSDTDTEINEKKWQKWSQSFKPAVINKDENANVSRDRNKSECERCCSESQTSVRTRLSFIANRKQPCISAKDNSAEQEIDIQFDIDISSHFVKKAANMKKLSNTRSGSRPNKIRENTLSDISKTPPLPRRPRRNAGNHSTPDFRRKQKTVIMLVLTSVFVITMLLYVVLITFVAGTEGILKTLTNSQKAVFFFFWRLYFSNTVINPLLYGFYDPRFRKGLFSFCKRKKSFRSNDLRHCSTLQSRKRTVFTLS